MSAFLSLFQMIQFFIYIYLIAFNFYLVNNIAQKAIFFLLEKIY